MYLYERQLQAGAGLGSLFKTLFKIASPLVRRVGQRAIKSGVRIGKRAGRRAIKSGVRELGGLSSDILSGDNIKMATKKRVGRVVNKVIKSAIKSKSKKKKTKTSRGRGGVQGRSSIASRRGRGGLKGRGRRGRPRGSRSHKTDIFS